MILQALRNLAIQENLVADPDLEYKPISWQVTLHSDGRLAAIEDMRRNVNEGTKRKPRYEGKPILVPRQPIRTSGALAFFLVDKAEYVFGVDPAEKRSPDDLKRRSELFREQVESALEATGDEAVGAVAAFLRHIADDPSEIAGRLRSAEVGPSDLFAFRVGADDLFVHQRPAVLKLWKQRRQQQVPADAAPFQCLITGEPLAEVGLFPQIKKLPGGTPSGVALVSHNKRAFESYGLEGNENAPISRTAAEQAATALNRLLHPAYPDPGNPESTLRPRHIRLEADTVVCFWTASKSEESQTFLDALPDLLEGENEETVALLYRSVRSGTPVKLDDPTAFYALTLSGTQGRAILRDWFESSLPEVANNLAAHFADLRICRNARPKKGEALAEAIPLRWLMQSLAPDGRSSPVPGPLEAAFLRAAFTRTLYPFQILQRALVRARVEAGRDEWIDRARRDARAALLKAVLNRRRSDPQIAARYQEVQYDMNPNHDSPGYALGMLMAVLERLQGAALGDINATLVDRYFSAASASPRSTFIRLLRNAKHHSRKARDSDKPGDRGLAFRCERLIDQIADRFEIDSRQYPPKADGLPAHLDLEQQGLFVLGYHQMRHWLWLNADERARWEADHPDAPRAFRWLKEPKPDSNEEPAIA